MQAFSAQVVLAAGYCNLLGKMSRHIATNAVTYRSLTLPRLGRIGRRVWASFESRHTHSGRPDDTDLYPLIVKFPLSRDGAV